MSIVEFLLARIAEDEAEAAASPDGDRPGEADAAASPDGDRPAGRRAGRAPAGCRSRLLAECRAKRAIVALHPGATDPWGFEGCLTCGNVADTTEGYPCPTLRALAMVYADHPDHRQTWRP
ncbi:DUF6221 family protein [Georgenia sp. AZ-5]|uniref:DUF6221 family protein n=1 Tax=Georgenia sp. AZ-5 TaxID=3367526 RepID=UPI0037550444